MLALENKEKKDLPVNPQCYLMEKYLAFIHFSGRIRWYMNLFVLIEDTVEKGT